MPANKKSAPSEKKSISIYGNVTGNDVIIGDNNTVSKTTIIQKIFNIFKSDAETLEQRNRRILLGHVENAWIKGVLDASLHGAALLDLGIKQDPDAVKTYPWAIKKEPTDENLPAGASMLEIFDSIGMGRSLLILGAPGSGKTTMLLELARQLIAHAREDVTQPIPMVFNLASWTEKLTLADWLAQELNNLYSVPRKTAPDWVKGDKLLLLLDGLDEVRQESRAKCVEAINSFRKEHGLTSLAVCSRSQDYADLNAKLSFEGAIEVQPLMQKQITEFFNRFGDELVGIKQAIKKDSALREMAETPLFLSIMLMAFRDKQDIDILLSQDEKAQRRHLFDTYIERMFERGRSKKAAFKKQDVLRWLSWLAQKMIEHNQAPYLVENMQAKWLGQRQQWNYKLLAGLLGGMIGGILSRQIIVDMLIGEPKEPNFFYTLFITLIGWTGVGLVVWFAEIKMIDTLTWDWRRAIKWLIVGSIVDLLFVFIKELVIFVITILTGDIGINDIFSRDTLFWFIVFVLTQTIIYWSFIGWAVGLFGGLKAKPMNRTRYPGQKIYLSIRNSIFVLALSGLGVSFFGLLSKVFIWLIAALNSLNQISLREALEGKYGLSSELEAGILTGVSAALFFGVLAVIQHYALRLTISRNKQLPFRLIPFLDHCVDLIFLRRVGGGYIFVHRLLMEHFAEMYVEDNG